MHVDEGARRRGQCAHRLSVRADEGARRRGQTLRAVVMTCTAQQGETLLDERVYEFRRTCTRKFSRENRERRQGGLGWLDSPGGLQCIQTPPQGGI